MKAIDMTQATPADREQFLGREFRLIHVLSFAVRNFTCYTVAILGGCPVELLGDPVQALRVYLGGSEAGEVLQ